MCPKTAHAVIDNTGRMNRRIIKLLPSWSNSELVRYYHRSKSRCQSPELRSR